MVKRIDEWDIKTPNGWKPFGGVIKKGKEKLIKLSFESGVDVTATADHIFFQSDKKIKVKYLKINDTIDGLTKKLKIIDIKEQNVSDVFDIVESFEHKFVVNKDIITKNCDEFAFVPENMAEDFWRSNYPTVASNDGKIILVSTPKGSGGKFYQIYSDAEKGINGFKHIKVSWDRVPGRDEAWKEKTIKELGLVSFNQEHNCVSGNSVINIEVDGVSKDIKIKDLYDQGTDIL